MLVIKIVSTFILWKFYVRSNTFQCDLTLLSFATKSCEISGISLSLNESFFITNVEQKTLKILKLNEMNFTKLPQNIFIECPLIEFFFVSHCGLSRLAINDFENGNNLKEVFIHRTMLEVIPARIFRLSPNLEQLTLSECPNLQHIEKDAFNDLEKLKDLALLNLNLVTFPSNMLANMIALEHITMENCSLKILPEGFFRNNRNLTRISLVTNQLESIPDGMLDHLENLDELRLDSNNLLTLSTSKAQKLHAQNNQLQQLHITSITQTIMVQNNFITKITCDNDLNVILAFFSNNSLSSFNCFRHMTKVLQVLLNDNKFLKLELEAFNNLQTLDTFTINNNTGLKVDDNTFASLKVIRNLWVDELTTGYKNLREKYPELSMLYLTTRSWNCSYLKQVANVLNSQQIYLRFINEYEDFVNFKCQLKMWDVSKFE